METVKSAMRHPLTSRLWWIGVWAILSFAVVVGSYKANFENMSDNVDKITATVTVLHDDMIVVKTKLGIPLK